MTPTIKAKANKCITSPPNKYNITTTIKVVNDVIIVRLSVLFNDILTISKWARKHFGFGGQACTMKHVEKCLKGNRKRKRKR